MADAASGLSTFTTGLATTSIFFCFLIVKTRRVGETLITSVPPSNSSPSRTLEGFFELTLRPSRALDLPRALLSELQRYKDTVR